MRIEAYCDESYPDLFSSDTPQAKYLVIGSLWLKTDDREAFKASIHGLRDKHKIGGEFKWQKASPSRVSFYQDLVTWFFEQQSALRFRCIAVDRSQINLAQYHDNDQELGFYKFYYQMLHKWIHDNNRYKIFCDFKSNRITDRLNVLQRYLEYSNILARIESVQAVRSKESVLMQMADFLTGAASAKLNDRIIEGSSKQQLVSHLQSLLGTQISPTPLGEKKFNVFKISLHGGW
jgi:hypothetical protein